MAAHNTGSSGGEVLCISPAVTELGEAPENTVCPVPAPTDPVNRPIGYVSHPSRIECIEISEWLCANLAQALQYVWRAPYKGRMQEDLDKAIWFVREQERVMGSGTPTLIPASVATLIRRVIRVETNYDQRRTAFGQFLAHIGNAHQSKVHPLNLPRAARLIELMKRMAYRGERWWA